MKRLELLDWAAARIVGDEVAKLAENVGGRLDELLVRCGRLEVTEDDLRGVRLGDEMYVSEIGLV